MSILSLLLNARHGHEHGGVEVMSAPPHYLFVLMLSHPPSVQDTAGLSMDAPLSLRAGI